jgi:DNA-binding transcriptional regulator YiaG
MAQAAVWFGEVGGDGERERKKKIKIKKFDKCNYICYHLVKMTTIDRKRFARAIKKYREDNDLTQKELAQRLVTTTTTIARWELGLNIPKQESVLREIKSLGVTW